ncbi:MAG: F0F1 ATP synthase subunit A [bacterium]|nr:F0F1 ATP synthase subunit A [bacterium]
MGEGIHISFQAEVLGSIFGIPVSNSLILALITGAVLVGSGLFAVRALSLVPPRIQSVAEMIIEGLLGLMDQILGNREQALKFFPLVASIFLFILFNNWLGLLPGIGSFGFTEGEVGHEVFVPFFRSANSDLNTTLALALISVGATQLFGIAHLGFFKHVSRFINFKNPITFFVGILEIIGEFAKVVSFSFRLFGNIFAGEVLLIIIMTLVPVLVPFPFLFLELFVGFIQALVFAVLTLIFLKVATETAEH